ncbi:MAG: polymer-forming cytoskeletal protein [Candidatus Sedimenticola endophacoides]
MSRFSKFKAPKIATVIGVKTTVKGDVSFSGGLHIDGSVEGNILAKEGRSAALTLSEKGRVEGDIRVPNVILNGTVIGDVYASERVELAQNAKISGTVYYKLLEMVMGAEVNGQLIHSDDIEQKRLGYDGPNGQADALDVGAG